LALFAPAGPIIFEYLTIRLESLMAAGGLLLLAIALQMFPAWPAVVSRASN
jgi:small neutral amino acid transporter SnatA (MarC family)